jgi:hypothetical protein
MQQLALSEFKVPFNAIAPLETSKTAPETSNTEVWSKFLPPATELRPATQLRRFTMQASYQTNNAMAAINDSARCLEGSPFKCGSSCNVLLLILGSFRNTIGNARFNPLILSGYCMNNLHSHYENAFASLIFNEFHIVLKQKKKSSSNEMAFLMET